MQADFYKTLLAMVPHPEGGYYKELLRTPSTMETTHGTRNTLTSIYYLLEKGDKSKFHRLRSDEVWYYHHGQTALIHLLTNNGLVEIPIGPDSNLQVHIPKDTWFAASLTEDSDYILVSCAVAPGFDFADFELGEVLQLKMQFPEHMDIIDFYMSGK